MKNRDGEEIITIEEALYDYKEAYNDYMNNMKKTEKFLQNDKDVLTGILSLYFKDFEISIRDSSIILNKTDNAFRLDGDVLEHINDLKDIGYLVKVSKTESLIIELEEKREWDGDNIHIVLAIMIISFLFLLSTYNVI